MGKREILESSERLSLCEGAMLFGDYLRCLLSSASIAPLDVAVGLGIDASLVYRWMRHERVPGANSNYVDRIANLLNLDAATLMRLRESQALSLNISREERVARRLSSSTALDGWIDEGSESRRSPSQLPPRRDYSPVALLRTIMGRHEVFEALLETIEHLPEAVSPHDQLVLTSQGEDILDHDAELQRTWRTALRGALARGWQIEQFVRLGGDLRRNVRFSRDLLALLPGGRHYQLHLLPERTLLIPAQDFLLGPSPIGGLLLLATTQERHSDTALMLQHPGQVALLHGYVRQFARRAVPAAYPFPQGNREEYWRTITEIGERPGPRWQIKEGLSVLTRPPGWYAEGAPWWRSHGHTAASAALWRRRVAAFERHLRPRQGGFSHRDMVPQQALEHYVATGIHPSDQRADGQGIPDSEEERLEHLERLLALLKSERYELALVRDLPERQYLGEVKENQAALLQVYGDAHAGGSPERTDYIVSEPPLVNAIAAVFEEWWQNLAFNERDKQTVFQLIAAKRDALRSLVRRARRSRTVSGTAKQGRRSVVRQVN